MVDSVSVTGRDGLTHNMLDVIHKHWKSAEVVRIKCMGVPTIDMKNVCTQLEVYAFLYPFKLPCLSEANFSIMIHLIHPDPMLVEL